MDNIYELETEQGVTRNEVIVFFVSDGMDKVSPEFCTEAKKAQLFHPSLIPDYYIKEQEKSRMMTATAQFEHDKLKDINKHKPTLVDFKDTIEGMSEFKDMASNNILHCFVTKSRAFKAKYNKNLDINFIWGIKHANRGKIESHLWFFRGICSYLEPDHCFVIDAGTRPLPGSLSRLNKELTIKPWIGGACGEIEVELPNTIMSSAYFLCAA